MTRRIALIAALLAAFLFGWFVPSAFAGDATPFTSAAFKAAQAAGQPILVEVHADWCPTCKAQQPILSSLTADPKFKKLVVFRVDFDKQTQVLRDFNVRQQSTLIVFKGSTEVGRSVGDTRAASIADLVAKTL